MLDLFTRPESWAAIATLALLEIVLGIDNIVFIAVLTGKLPEAKQSQARQIGLGLALVTRLALLMALAWVMTLDRPIVTVAGTSFSGKALILLGGGLFLITKATREIYVKTELVGEEDAPRKRAAAFGMVILQIGLIDVIFSLDSVVTAIGMVGKIPLMVTAILISMGVMLISANSVGNFINRHPSLKILALSFLLLIGVLLVAEGMGREFEKGYVYFAMGFALLVETLDMRRQKNLRLRRLQGHEGQAGS